MRIVYVSRALPVHHFGGMEVNSYGLARTMATRGHLVTVYSTAHPLSLEHDYEELDMSGRLRLIYLGRTSPGEYSKAFGLALTEALERSGSRPNIIHSHNSSVLGLFRAGFFSRSRVPYVLTWHGTHLDWICTALKGGFPPCSRAALTELGYAWSVFRRLVLEDFALARASRRLIALDQSSASSIRLQFLVTRSMVEVIPVGVNTELFSPREFPEAPTALPQCLSRLNSPLLLFVGRLVPEKGVTILLQALHAMSLLRSDVRLVIVGDGPERQSLEQMVRRLGLDDRTIFLGALPPMDLPALYRNASLFVNPVLHAGGFNTTLVEAMACGCPVVTSHVGGARTLIDHNVDGILVPPGNATALAEACTRLIADEQTRVQLAKQASEKVKSRFSLEVSAARIEELYEDVL